MVRSSGVLSVVEGDDRVGVPVPLTLGYWIIYKGEGRERERKRGGEKAGENACAVTMGGISCCLYREKLFFCFFNVVAPLFCNKVALAES